MAIVGTKRKSKAIPLLAGLAAGSVTTAVAAGIGFGVFPPEGVGGPGGSVVPLDMINGLRAGFAWSQSVAGFGADWDRWMPLLAKYGMVGGVKGRVGH